MEHPPVAQVDRRPLLGYGIYLVAALLWALNGTVSKYLLLGGVPWARLSQLRVTAALVILVVIVAITRRSALRLRRHEIKRLAVYGILGIAATQSLYFLAIQKLPVGVALLFEFTAPIMVALWFRFVLREPVRDRVFAALVLALVGLAMVAQVWQGFSLDVIGVAAALAAAVALALYYILGERLVVDRDPLSLTMWGFAFAAAFWAVVMPWWSFPWDTLAQTAMPFGDDGPAVPGWVLVAWMVVLGTVVPFVLALQSLRHIRATQASVVGMTEPVMASRRRVRLPRRGAHARPDPRRHRRPRRRRPGGDVPLTLPIAAASWLDGPVAEHPVSDPDRGVDLVPGADGRVSTSAVATAVVGAALGSVDPAAAVRAASIRDWRKGYLSPYRDLVVCGARTADAADSVARVGLTALHARSTFVRGGDAVPLLDACTSWTEPAFSSVTVDGTPSRDVGLSLPFHGKRLFGADVRRRLDAWVAEGVVERGLATSIHTLLDHPDWLDLSDTTVVVLGAGAEMGPLRSLLRWGAHVVAVDLPRPEVWARVIATARSSAGRLTVPVPLGASPADDEALAAVAGADLIRRLPEVRTWLAGLESAFTLGTYTYADGATHVRVALAADALGQSLLGDRRDVGLAFLATPTDVYSVPADAVAESRRRWDARGLSGLAQLPLRAVGRFAPNYPDTVETDHGDVGIADCLVPQQGPNYALAKRLQRWRATQSRRDGVWTSLNIAPATRTRSVVKNRALAAAYAGAHRFGVEVFEPSTSNTLMAALLVHDLRSSSSLARPDAVLAHPDQAWAHQAAHGGLWRSAYAPRSVLGIAAALGMVTRG